MCFHPNHVGTVSGRDIPSWNISTPERMSVAHNSRKRLAQHFTINALHLGAVTVLKTALKHWMLVGAPSQRTRRKLELTACLAVCKELGTQDENPRGGASHVGIDPPDYP